MSTTNTSGVPAVPDADAARSAAAKKRERKPDGTLAAAPVVGVIPQRLDKKKSEHAARSAAAKKQPRTEDGTRLAEKQVVGVIPPTPDKKSEHAARSAAAKKQHEVSNPRAGETMVVGVIPQPPNDKKSEHAARKGRHGIPAVPLAERLAAQALDSRVREVIALLLALKVIS